MTTRAPASARAWTQASPIARPPPVTTATRPSSLYLSRYTGCVPSLLLLTGRVGGIGEGVALQMRQCASLGIEQMAGLGIDMERNPVMDAGRIAACGLHNDQG